MFAKLTQVGTTETLYTYGTLTIAYRPCYGDWLLSSPDVSKSFAFMFDLCRYLSLATGVTVTR